MLSRPVGRFLLAGGLLGLAPELLQSIGIQTRQIRLPFHMPEAPAELVAGPAQGHIRVQLQLTGQIDHAEQQVTELLKVGELDNFLRQNFNLVGKEIQTLQS